MASRPRTERFSEQAAHFGRRVRDLREARNWSQLQLAERSGVSFRRIQQIETNTNNEKPSASAPQPANPKLDTVFLLAEALEVDVSELFAARRAR